MCCLCEGRSKKIEAHIYICGQSHNKGQDQVSLNNGAKISELTLFPYMYTGASENYCHTDLDRTQVSYCRIMVINIETYAALTQQQAKHGKP